MKPLMVAIAGTTVVVGLIVGLGRVGLLHFPPLSLSAAAPRSSSPDEDLSDRRDRCLTDPSFVWIPPGAFIAGSDEAEQTLAYRISAEGWATVSSQSLETPEEIERIEQRLRQQRWFDGEPRREGRSLSGFCIQQNLVTQAEYAAFVSATEHPVPDISAEDYQDQGFLVHPYEDVEPYRWQAGTFPEGKAQHPVVLVSYGDALAYAEWRGDQDTATYRLPTAMEWEKAARGEDGRYFPWGNDWQEDATNWIGSGINGTSAIATFPMSQSPYEVNDMAGNVFEFTSTLFDRTDTQISVMKGCSWDDLPGFCRAAYRHTRPVDSRHILFGFRLVKE
jgi:formylglycine-generating enzyme required for sulfatase activity